MKHSGGDIMLCIVHLLDLFVFIWQGGWNYETLQLPDSTAEFDRNSMRSPEEDLEMSPQSDWGSVTISYGVGYW